MSDLIVIGVSAATGALFGLLLGLLFFDPGMALLGGTILKTSPSESDEKELAEELTGQA